MHKENWYQWCVQHACFYLYAKDIKGWIFWWCERNRYTQNLTSAEIDCYRKFKLERRRTLQADLLATVNGKPKTVWVNLTKRTRT